MRPEMRVKILNGREHILTVEQAAERLRFFGLKCERIENLTVPYEIAWPFRMARSGEAISAGESPPVATW